MRLVFGFIAGLVLFNLSTEGMLSRRYKRSVCRIKAASVSVLLYLLPYIAAIVGLYMTFKCIIAL